MKFTKQEAAQMIERLRWAAADAKEAAINELREEYPYWQPETLERSFCNDHYGYSTMESQIQRAGYKGDQISPFDVADLLLLVGDFEIVSECYRNRYHLTLPDPVDALRALREEEAQG